MLLSCALSITYDTSLTVVQASQPITAVPNYGGSDGHGATGFQIMGDGPVPTPKQLVEQLDQYVIGQKQAKKVCNRAA